jgi:hypothetical protein
MAENLAEEFMRNVDTLAQLMDPTIDEAKRGLLVHNAVKKMFPKHDLNPIITKNVLFKIHATRLRESLGGVHGSVQTFLSMHHGWGIPDHPTKYAFGLNPQYDRVFLTALSLIKHKLKRNMPCDTDYHSPEICDVDMDTFCRNFSSKLLHAFKTDTTSPEDTTPLDELYKQLNRCVNLRSFSYLLHAVKPSDLRAYPPAEALLRLYHEEGTLHTSLKSEESVISGHMSMVKQYDDCRRFIHSLMMLRKVNPSQLKYLMGGKDTLGNRLVDSFVAMRVVKHHHFHEVQVCVSDGVSVKDEDSHCHCESFDKFIQGLREKMTPTMPELHKECDCMFCDSSLAAAGAAQAAPDICSPPPPPPHSREFVQRYFHELSKDEGPPNKGEGPPNKGEGPPKKGEGPPNKGEGPPKKGGQNVKKTRRTKTRRTKTRRTKTRRNHYNN